METIPFKNGSRTGTDDVFNATIVDECYAGGTIGAGTDSGSSELLSGYSLANGQEATTENGKLKEAKDNIKGKVTYDIKADVDITVMNTMDCYN